MIRMRAYCNRLFGLLIISLMLIIALATSSQYEGDHDEVYIVYMGKTTSSVINGDIIDPRNDHAQLLNELSTRKEIVVVQTYHKSFLGFAARLSKKEAQSFAQRSGVVSVFPNRALKPHTTRSWDFLMTQNAPGFRTSNGFAPTTYPRVSNLSFGGAHDTIIGILDSGIWPDHPSFNDKHMSPVPTLWKGICMPGENVTNKFKCNKKVIGARYYEDTVYPGSITTPMDEDGHGTECASIAAGRQVEGASYYGLAKGIARGGSQGSRIAVYRVCGRGCWTVSILKAFDDAIADGVDVISISAGGRFDESFQDPIFIGSFHAAEKGITVVGSAGNSGPSPMTVENFAPWMLSVGATTIDRDFESGIVLAPNKKIKGEGINFSGLSNSAIYPLIDGRSAATSNQSYLIANASYCVPGSLDDHKVKGKIVLCDDNGDIGLFFDKIKRLEKQGPIGIIIISNYFRQSPYYYGTTPIVIVTVDNGAQISSYIKTNKNPLATVLPTVVTPMNYKPAPVVPDFSSRGPIPNIENLLKPDVTAPGVGIIAASSPIYDDSYIPLPGKVPPLFNIDTGTSMSCPHVSGVAATVKSLHPTWGSSAIRSAIMTTAIQTNNLHVPITTVNGTRATPYDIGAGEISLFSPLYPGLVYETETIEYIHFLCNMGYNTSIIHMISSDVPNNFNCPNNSSPDLISDMNYPSMVVSGITPNRMRSVKRTVTNVGEEYSNYVATVEAPAGVQVRVVPNKLRFTKNVRKQTFEVIFTVTTSSMEEDLFGAFTWSNWKHKVRSPIVVARTKK